MITLLLSKYHIFRCQEFHKENEFFCQVIEFLMLIASPLMCFMKIRKNIDSLILICFLFSVLFEIVSCFGSVTPKGWDLIFICKNWSFFRIDFNYFLCYLFMNSFLKLHMFLKLKSFLCYHLVFDSFLYWLFSISFMVFTSLV